MCSWANRRPTATNQFYNKILVEEIFLSAEASEAKMFSDFIFANLLVSCKSIEMKKYFTKTVPGIDPKVYDFS